MRCVATPHNFIKMVSSCEFCCKIVKSIELKNVGSQYLAYKINRNPICDFDDLTPTSSYKKSDEIRGFRYCNNWLVMGAYEQLVTQCMPIDITSTTLEDFRWKVPELTNEILCSTMVVPDFLIRISPRTYVLTSSKSWTLYYRYSKVFGLGMDLFYRFNYKNYAKTIHIKRGE